MRRLLLVKGNHDIRKIFEIEKLTIVVTEKGTFKLRDNMHSDTFMIKEGSEFTPISRMLELCPLDFKELYNILPFCTPASLDFHEFDIGSENLATFCQTYYLFQRNGAVSKLKYSEIVKILQYLQTLENPAEFNLFGAGLDDLKQWILSTFKRTSAELGFFLLLDCIQNNRISSFLVEWKSIDLFETDIQGLVEILEDSFLDKREKERLKKFLLKLK